MRELTEDDFPESNMTQEEWEKQEGYDFPTVVDKNELMTKYKNKEITLHELYALKKQRLLSGDDFDEFFVMAVEKLEKRGISV